MYGEKARLVGGVRIQYGCYGCADPCEAVTGVRTQYGAGFFRDQAPESARVGFLFFAWDRWPTPEWAGAAEVRHKDFSKRNIGAQIIHDASVQADLARERCEACAGI